MRKFFLFLLKFFSFSIAFFLLWLVIEKYALAALGRIVLVPITLFGYQPTGIEVVGKSIHFLSAIPGRKCQCDVELAPMGFIVFLSLAFSVSPIGLTKRLKATGLGLLLLLAFHVLYLSLRVLLFSPGGFQGTEAYLVRFFAPAAILFPVVIWVLLFPTGLLDFGKDRRTRLTRDVCPLCGSRRKNMEKHILESHGPGKKGLKSSLARRYFELFKDETPR